MATIRKTPKTAPESFRAELRLFDFTLLVTGAIIGDGIYVVSSLGARELGPAQLVAWVVAGVLAGIIALAFIQCASIDQEVGGSYSYARMAFGPLIGFLAGWTLYLGEWTALSVFPQAFFNYFRALTGASAGFALPVKLTLICALTMVNLLGVKQGARTNDTLTTAKLVPLILLTILGLAFLALHFGHANSHLQPFAPIGWGGFGKAMLPIFWAYAGFELAVLPAAEVRTASKTLPKGLMIGVAIAITLYLTNSLAVVIAVPWKDTASSTHPVANAMGSIFAALGLPAKAGSSLMSLGALISIAGVFVVFTLALARLSYALSVDGFLPSPFRALHGRYRTPYFGLLFQAASSAIFSTVFGLGSLLSTAVLFLSLCYCLTALSAIKLVRLNPKKALNVPLLQGVLIAAAGGSLYLAAQASAIQLAVAAGAVGLGLANYVLTSNGRNHLASRDVAGLQHAPGDDHPHAWLHRTIKRRPQG